MPFDDPVINRADYDYMDNMPLEGWIWEFIRRNAGYREAYRSCQTSNLSFSEWIDKLNALIDDYAIGGITLEGVALSREHYLMLDISGFSPSFNTYLFNPDTRYDQFGEHKPNIFGLTPLKAFKFGEEEILRGIRFEDEKSRYAYILSHVLAPVRKEDTLYIGISLKAPLKYINKELKNILAQYIQRRRSRERPPEWKYYLIAYDLRARHPDLTNENMGTRLANAYPYITERRRVQNRNETREIESSDYFRSENCRNFYNGALRLIGGDYKSYLYL